MTIGVFSMYGKILFTERSEFYEKVPFDRKEPFFSQGTSSVDRSQTDRVKSTDRFKTRTFDRYLEIEKLSNYIIIGKIKTNRCFVSCFCKRC
jgi:hypothetical protein